MQIGRNEFTSKFDRDTRFLIDDPDGKHMHAYLLTKPLRVGHVYNGKGIYAFVLQEVVETDDDNRELAIADYYKHFDKDGNVLKKDVEEKPEQGQPSSTEKRKVWI